jgi:hypothetical protein
MLTMKSEVVGRPAVVSDDLVHNVHQKIVKDDVSQFHNFRVNFRKLHATLLCELITVRLGYHHKFCARWVPKMLMGAHKTQRMASALVF